MTFSATLPLTASATVAMHAKALAKKARGERVYNLGAGEPILPPHVLVASAAEEAVRAGKTLYPPVAGIPELRRAASAWMNTMYGTQHDAQNTLVTCGGKFGIFASLQAYCSSGDEVMIIAPYWVSYAQLTTLFRGVPTIVQTREEDGWKASVAQLESAATDRTKILILNNAANPTGTLYSREELKAMLAWAEKRKLLVISDEVYSGLVYGNEHYVSCGSFPEYRDRVIVIQSCSKHFAMTGWRVGFVFAPEEIIKVLTAIQSQSTTGTSSISQWAAFAAFQNADRVMQTVRDAMHERRDVFTQTLNNAFGISLLAPKAGLYHFVNLQALGVYENSLPFCLRLLEEGNIASVPGSAFGQEGYVRFSFGEKKEELIIAVQALSRYLKGI